MLANTAFSQRNASIAGVIADRESNDKIPFASVSLLKNNEFISVGSISDDAGSFKLEGLSFGNYSVVVSFIGYTTDTIENISLSKENALAKLGVIQISASNVALNEVQVTAMSNTVTSKIDRKTYQAKDFETAKGGNAVDLLNKLPSVSVSPDGEVSVRGTTDFIVYLNGKPTQMEPSMLLAQISSDAIENIDVITVPSARFDAQGKGGIINISTKTNGVEGFSIATNGNLGASPWGNKTDKYSAYNLNDDRYGGGINLSYGKENLNIYGGFNYNYKNVNGARTGDARILDTTNNSYKHMVAAGERPEWYEYYSANAGIDYQFSKASQVSASYFYGNRTEGRSAFYIYNNFYGDQQKNPIIDIPVNDEWIYNPNTDNRYGMFHTINVDFTHKLDNNAEIRTSFLYENSNLSRELDNYNYDYNPSNDQVNDVQLRFNQTDETPLDGYRFTFDYAKEFDNGNTLGLGVQPQFFTIEGDFSYDTLDVATNQLKDYTDLENGIDLTRGIYAAYIDYSGLAGKLSYVVGLRLEYTDQKMEIDNPDYFTIFDRPTKPSYTLQKLDWFPTLHASYAIGETNKLNLAASRRISRPPIKNMAPFLYRRHLEVYVVGDPALKPEYVNNVELSYEQDFGKQKVNITGFYRGVDNAIFRVNTIYTEEMVLIRSYTNSGNSDALGLELNANLEAGRFAKFFVGGSLYSYQIKGDIFGYQVDNSSTNWSLKGTANFIFTKELKFTADFDIRSATITAQGQNDLFYMANTALNYSPKKMEGWNFSLKILDILDSNIEGLDTRAFNSAGQEIFYQETEYNRTGPIAEFGVSYSFNVKGKSKKEIESSFGKSEF